MTASEPADQASDLGAPNKPVYDLNVLVNGLPVSVKAPHVKVRRDGYRQPARRIRKGDSG